MGRDHKLPPLDVEGLSKVSGSSVRLSDTPSTGVASPPSSPASASIYGMAPSGDEVSSLATTFRPAASTARSYQNHETPKKKAYLQPSHRRLSMSSMASDTTSASSAYSKARRQTDRVSSPQMSSSIYTANPTSRFVSFPAATPWTTSNPQSPLVNSIRGHQKTSRQGGIQPLKETAPRKARRIAGDPVKIPTGPLKSPYFAKPPDKNAVCWSNDKFEFRVHSPEVERRPPLLMDAFEKINRQDVARINEIITGKDKSTFVSAHATDVDVVTSALYTKSEHPAYFSGLTGKPHAFPPGRARVVDAAWHTEPFFIPRTVDKKTTNPAKFFDHDAIHAGVTYNDKLLGSEILVDASSHRDKILGVAYEYSPGMGRVQTVYVDGPEEGRAAPLVILPKMTPYDILKWKAKKQREDREKWWNPINWCGRFELVDIQDEEVWDFVEFH